MAANRRASNPRSRLIASSAGILILVAAIIGAWALWPKPLPPLDAPTVDLVKFAVTDQFASLSDDQKMEYVDVLQKQGIAALAVAAAEAKLTPEQRERAIDAGTQAAINLRWGPALDEWLKLDEKGKKAYVKKIAESSPSRPKPGANVQAIGKATGRDRGMTPARQKGFIENTSPGRRAALAEFMSAVKEERAALGK
jgi:hypothetical protein